MKKILGIVVLGLLFCSDVFALSQQQFIDQNLKGRKLDQIEGVWITSTGRIYGFYKSGSQYYNVVISSNTFRSGETIGTLTKGSKNVFYGSEKFIMSNGTFSGTATYNVYGNSLQVTQSYGNQTGTFTDQRLWPNDLTAHNAKFKTKKDIADEEKVIADMVADARKTCKVLGFEDGSEKFADCTLKLYTQKVDELVAEKQAANALMTQNQTTTTTQQSSGSNVTTIYDPVRDSKSLMQQGQKMLSGACTLGINC